MAVFTRENEYIHPDKALRNVEEFLKFAHEKGWTDEELYFVVKLAQVMFD